MIVLMKFLLCINTQVFTTPMCLAAFRKWKMTLLFAFQYELVQNAYRGENKSIISNEHRSKAELQSHFQENGQIPSLKFCRFVNMSHI